MSESPGSWQLTKVGELISLDYGRSLGAAQRSGEGYPVYGSSGEVGSHSSFLVEGPGIVVGRKGTVGAVVWSGKSFWPIDTTYYVQWLSESKVSRRWTYWRLHSLPLRKLDSSTGVPGLNRNDVYDLVVSVPPLCEQRRIAEILDTVDEAITSTERLIAKLEQTKQGLLDAMLTESHQHALLRERAAVSVGHVGPTEAFYTDANSGVPFLRTGNITSKGISLKNLRYVTKAFHLANRKSALQPGDVVVSRVGYTGTAAVIPRLGEANCANMIVIRSDRSLNPDFLRLLFGTEVVKRQVLGFTAGSAQPVLNIRLVQRLKIPIPPLVDQLTIVDWMESTDVRLEAEENELSKLRLLKQGLMDDLLTGRVRMNVAEEASV